MTRADSGLPVPTLLGRFRCRRMPTNQERRHVDAISQNLMFVMATVGAAPLGD